MLKKYGFWIVLTLVVLGGAWYWWKNNKPKGNTTKKGEETKDTSNPNTNAAATTTDTTPKGDYISDSYPGGYATIKKHFWENKDAAGAQFRNQTLSIEYRGKNKGQTALLQKFLNHNEKAGLVVDGDFGPATEAAVLKKFGKKGTNLNEVATAYKLLVQNGQGNFDMVDYNTKLWPW